jgi:hypothetical protein
MVLDCAIIYPHNTNGRYIVSKQSGLFFAMTLLLGLVLASGLGGCSGGEVPTPTETPAVLVEGLQGLDSYHVYLKMGFESATGSGVTQDGYEMDIDYVDDPFAQYVAVWREDTIEYYEFFYFDDRQYLIAGEGECVYLPAEGDEAMDPEVFKPDDVLGQDTRRVQPDEYVNDILCHHYVIDRTDPADESNRTEGEVWIAAEGNYIVKYTLQIKSTDPDTGDTGRANWEYEVSDINAPITIERPTDCEEAVVGEFPGVPSPTD